MATEVRGFAWLMMNWMHRHSHGIITYTDSAGRLHGKHGPAICWPGGEQTWYWYGSQCTGQMVEADIVMTDDQLVEQLHSRTVHARGVIRYHTTRATCTNAWAVRQPY